MSVYPVSSLEHQLTSGGASDAAGRSGSAALPKRWHGRAVSRNDSPVRSVMPEQHDRVGGGETVIVATPGG